MKRIVVLFLLLGTITNSHAQRKKKTSPIKEPVINQSFNRIFCGTLDSFYTRLHRLEKIKNGTVTVVQIGDSHTQPDFISSVVREKLQQRFGNAGRGLVFPYQLAQSNAPLDIISSSYQNWSFNRVAHPEINSFSGISGFEIESSASAGRLDFELKDRLGVQQNFSRIQLFYEKDSEVVATLVVGSDTLQSESSNSIKLPQPTNKFSWSFSGNQDTVRFFGAVLASGKPGVFYHNIGVNGAKYEHYNLAPVFWQQLSSLKADLYIVSLGTNEAQSPVFDPVYIEQQLSLFIQNIRAITPEADILITTSADSYKKGVYNAEQREVNNCIARYCEKNRIPIWDLYRVTNGFGASKRWMQKGYMNKDGVHYLRAGYEIHGQLLRDCLMQGYEKYIKSNF